jgi:hypothetical protein
MANQDCGIHNVALRGLASIRLILMPLTALPLLASTRLNDPPEPSPGWVGPKIPKPPRTRGSTSRQNPAQG